MQMDTGPDRRQLHSVLDAMFRQDERGRLTGDAPLLYVLRSTSAVLCALHATIPDAVAAEIEAAVMADRGRPGRWAEDYARYLSSVQAVASVTAIRAGPLFKFPDDLPATSGCVVVDSTNLDLLRGYLDEWCEDAESGSPMVVALADGRAVSVCATARSSAAVHCAGVETAPHYRGRGLAPRVTAAWANLVRAGGAEPFYATTFDNLASQAVARRLGLNLVASEFSIYGQPTHR